MTDKTNFVFLPKFHEQGVLEEVEFLQRVWFLADNKNDKYEKIENMKQCKRCAGGG